MYVAISVRKSRSFTSLGDDNQLEFDAKNERGTKVKVLRNKLSYATSRIAPRARLYSFAYGFSYGDYFRRSSRDITLARLCSVMRSQW